MRRLVVAASIVFVFLVALASPAPAGPVARSQGVYVTLLSGLRSDVAAAATKVEESLKAAGFNVLASYDNGVPEGCRAKSRTVVFAQDAFASAVLTGGADRAFGLPLRLAVYDTEAGVSVGMANPVSLFRTFNEASVKDETAQKVVDQVAAALAPVGSVVQKAAGQIRDSGQIGGMGGGPFSEKIVPVLSVVKSPSEAAAALKAGIGAAAGWHAVYSYKASDDVFVVGVTNQKTEGRSFGIAGEKRATSSAPFPGIDHAAAFPIEIVVSKKGASSSISILKEMWRMKLYFQDAGNWAFMKNMQMPGDIQSEVEAAIRKALP